MNLPSVENFVISVSYMRWDAGRVAHHLGGERHGLGLVALHEGDQIIPPFEEAAYRLRILLYQFRAGKDDVELDRRDIFRAIDQQPALVMLFELIAGRGAANIGIDLAGLERGEARRRRAADHDRLCPIGAGPAFRAVELIDEPIRGRAVRGHADLLAFEIVDAARGRFAADADPHEGRGIRDRADGDLRRAFGE